MSFEKFVIIENYINVYLHICTKVVKVTVESVEWKMYTNKNKNMYYPSTKVHRKLANRIRLTNESNTEVPYNKKCNDKNQVHGCLFHVCFVLAKCVALPMH